MDKRKVASDALGNGAKGRSRGKKAHKPAKDGGATTAKRGKEPERGGYEITSDSAQNSTGQIRLRQREIRAVPPPVPTQWDGSSPIKKTSLRADAKEFTFEPHTQPNSFVAPPLFPVFVPRNLISAAPSEPLRSKQEDAMDESILSTMSLRADAREFVPCGKR